jgi:hypothetical protein
LEYCHLYDRDPQLLSWVPNLARKSTAQLLTKLEASGLSRCCAKLVGEGTLKVIGRRVATVKQAQLVHLEDSDEELIAVVRKLAPSHLDGTFMGGGRVFDAYGHVISSEGYFTEQVWPPDPKFPGFEISSTYRWCVLRGNFLKSRVITQLPPDKCALLPGRITL